MHYTVSAMTPPSDIFPDDKAGLRASLRARRQSLDKEERLALSRAAAGHLLRERIWTGAETVALYIAVRGEIDTEPLLRAAWDSGKQVLLPLCSPAGDAHMRFAPCSGPDGLTPGAYGIPEPICAEPVPLACGEPDVIVVPGLAFDRKGIRLGQGGGFYDRYFARPETAGALRIGLAYSFQIVEKLPKDPWDLPVDGVCTEQGILWTAK